MKNIILTLSLFTVLSSSVLAQSAEPSLFPDLDIETVEDEVISETTAPEENGVTPEVVESNSEEVSEKVVEAEANDGSITDEAVVEEEEAIDEETDEEKDKKVYFALTDMKNTLAAVRSVSFCSGAFVMYNGTDRTVQEISGTFAIGDKTHKFSFPNVEKGQSVGWKFQMVGKACESLLKLPNVQILTCKIKGLSDKKCREKLIFTPIPSSNAAAS